MSGRQKGYARFSNCSRESPRETKIIELNNTKIWFVRQPENSVVQNREGTTENRDARRSGAGVYSAVDVPHSNKPKLELTQLCSLNSNSSHEQHRGSGIPVAHQDPSTTLVTRDGRSVRGARRSEASSCGRNQKINHGPLRFDGNHKHASGSQQHHLSKLRSSSCYEDTGSTSLVTRNPVSRQHKQAATLRKPTRKKLIQGSGDGRPGHIVDHHHSQGQTAAGIVSNIPHGLSMISVADTAKSIPKLWSTSKDTRESGEIGGIHQQQARPTSNTFLASTEVESIELLPKSPCSEVQCLLVRDRLLRHTASEIISETANSVPTPIVKVTDSRQKLATSSEDICESVQPDIHEELSSLKTSNDPEAESINHEPPEAFDAEQQSRSRGSETLCDQPDLIASCQYGQNSSSRPRPESASTSVMQDGLIRENHQRMQDSEIASDSDDGRTVNELGNMNTTLQAMGRSKMEADVMNHGPEDSCATNRSFDNPTHNATGDGSADLPTISVISNEIPGDEPLQYYDVRQEEGAAREDIEVREIQLGL